MSATWIWAQWTGSAWNPPLVPYAVAGGTVSVVKLGLISDPNSGAPINQFCLVCGDSVMGSGAAWADLPPLDQAIWLYAAGQHPEDTELAAAIPSGPAGAGQPALSDADAASFAKAQAWLDMMNAPATTTGG